MPETNPSDATAWRGRLTHSISTKLISSLLAVMLIIFALLGYLTIGLHRQHLEAAALASAERVSDVIKRSTTYYMLHNDRQGLYHSIQTMAGEPGMIKVRILDPVGKINYSTDPAEVSRVLDNDRSQFPPQLNRLNRFRIYRGSDGQRVLAIITPIENQSGCSSATCHAHPADQQVLGVLDTNLSLAGADAQLAVSSIRMLAYTVGAMLLVAISSWLFVWRVVDKPINALQNGTEHLTHGDLGYQIEVQSEDEVGALARSFNGMSSQLRTANQEIVTWAKTLEDRVAEKTRELNRAHDHMVRVEKMASMGKLAAVVAHEVNNPLSGILTYAKLLQKWVATGQTTNEKREEALQCLDLIASESRRCGDLIKNLLTLSRTAPMNVQPTDLRSVIDRCLLLVRHPLDLGGIELQLKLADDLPLIPCDQAQIEQVLLALTMNAIDAMPRGGTLWLTSRNHPDQQEVEIQVRDDGAGIAPDVLPQIFEPFVTTKEHGRGVGLGLAISRGIMERHHGRISVESELGRGTVFTLSLPAQSGSISLAGCANQGFATNVR